MNGSHNFRIMETEIFGDITEMNCGHSCMKSVMQYPLKTAFNQFLTRTFTSFLNSFLLFKNNSILYLYSILISLEIVFFSPEMRFNCGHYANTEIQVELRTTKKYIHFSTYF